MTRTVHHKKHKLWCQGIRPIHFSWGRTGKYMGANWLVHGGELVGTWGRTGRYMGANWSGANWHGANWLGAN